MFSMKISNKNESAEFGKTINNIINYIYDKLNFAEPKVISDSSSVEIISGREISTIDEGVIIELLIRKHIVINSDEFDDRDALDKHISKIKHFCDQAKSIEDLQYLPINMRK